MKGLTISAENLVSGEFLTLILGFCWQLLKTFQEPPDFGDEDEGGKGKGSSSYESVLNYIMFFLIFSQRLFNWVKKTLDGKYPDVDLSDGFKSRGFQNGRVIFYCFRILTVCHRLFWL